jgi:pilus assembly protein Flp/PilA
MLVILSFLMGRAHASMARRAECGATLVEYALLLAMIAVVAIIALHFLGGSVSDTLNTVGSSINN